VYDLALPSSHGNYIQIYHIYYLNWSLPTPRHHIAEILLKMALVRFKEVKRTSNEKKRYKVKKMIKSNIIFSSRMDSLLN
jgi:hypothetical protein